MRYTTILSDVQSQIRGEIDCQTKLVEEFFPRCEAVVEAYQKMLALTRRAISQDGDTKVIDDTIDELQRIRADYITNRELITTYLESASAVSTELGQFYSLISNLFYRPASCLQLPISAGLSLIEILESFRGANVTEDQADRAIREIRDDLELNWRALVRWFAQHRHKIPNEADVLKKSPRIFLSYRRKDTSLIIGRIHEALAKVFGGDAVFVDFEGIGSGERFHSVIKERLLNSDVLIAVLGERWLNPDWSKSSSDIGWPYYYPPDAEDDEHYCIVGAEFLSHSERDHSPLRILEEYSSERFSEVDWVKLEIEYALAKGIPIIPLLIGEAALPSAEQLPRSMRRLLEFNAASLSPDARFKEDISKLATGIEGLFSQEQG